MSKKHWNMNSALHQIDCCDFECSTGPLSLNVAYQWIKEAAKIGPTFWPGQGVYYEVEAEAGGVKLTKWAHFYITGCRMDSNTNGHFWVYDLSNDPPAAWHYGTIQFRNVPGTKLSLLSGEERKTLGERIAEDDEETERRNNGPFGVGA